MIRPYNPADEPACLGLFDSNSPAFFDPADRDGYRDFLRKGTDYFVTEVGGEVRACGGCYVTDNGIGGLTWGMVRADCHRHGLGSDLLRYRLEVIRRVPHAWAVVLHTTPAVAPFFERFGFRTFRVIEGAFGPGLHKCSMRLVWEVGQSSSGIS